jgi:hypothetical protein
MASNSVDEASRKARIERIKPYIKDLRYLWLNLHKFNCLKLFSGDPFFLFCIHWYCLHMYTVIVFKSYFLWSVYILHMYETTKLELVSEFYDFMSCKCN